MDKHNSENLEEEIGKKYKKREKKKKAKMKVSGAGVKKLARLIGKK